MSTYTLQYRKEVKKTIQKNKATLKKRFDKWVEKLVKDPYKENDGLVKNKFYDGKQMYKKRFGSFRIIYVIYETEIKILFTYAGSRGQIYNI